MKVFIVGLGLMGASYGEALKNKGHQIYGHDNDQAVNTKALSDGLILSCDLAYLSQVDLVILALYPKDNIRFMIQYGHLLKPDQLVTDISGTKSSMVPIISDLIPKGVSYVSHHPMAGRAKAGYSNRDPKMFEGNKCIIVTTPKSTKKAEEVLKQITEELGFKQVTTIDPTTHDKLIAYTSQLTHVLAVALMHMKQTDETKNATGDSFRDLTRIANINEEMWTELFLENDHELTLSIDDMIDQLHIIKHMIKDHDMQSLKAYLKKAREMRGQYD